VVNDDNLSSEGVAFSGRVILLVRTDIPSLEFLDGKRFNIESDIVSGLGFGDSFVVHFNGFNFTL